MADDLVTQINDRLGARVLSPQDFDVEEIAELPEGYENSGSSCCQHIFMDKTTQDLLAPETRNKLRWCDDFAGLGCAKL